MERPKEFRRVVFSKHDLAEALIGEAGRAATIEISPMPKVTAKVYGEGIETQHFLEAEIISALVVVCNTFEIPVPRTAEKRIMIDRNRDDAIILQMAIGLAC